MDKSAVIIINPIAGQEEGAHAEEAIKKALKSKYSSVEVKHTKSAGDATQFAKSAAENAVDLVVAVGGDGTVNEVINGLAPTEQPPLLGIIPMGTVNDLARALDIPLQTKEAINLLTNGAKKEIDVGLANHQYFTNFIIIGHAAQAIHAVDNDEKAKLGSFAYFIEVAKEIAKDQTFQVQIKMDQEEWKGEAAILIVGLIDSLGGMDSVLADVALGDGVFHILLLNELNLSQVINMTPAMLSGKLSNSKNINYFTSKSIELSALDGQITASDLDGEKGPKLPIQLSILPKQLTVLTGLK